MHRLHPKYQRPLNALNSITVYFARSQKRGQGISANTRMGLSPEIGNVADANNGNREERGARAGSSLDHFVHRDDMIGLARDLG